MKKMLIISATISHNTFAEWKLIATTINDDEIFVETTSIKKNNGFVYYWRLTNFLKPIHGDLSSKVLMQLDCNVPRKHKRLSAMFYTGPMGAGNLDQIPQDRMNKEDWMYISPDSSIAFVTNYVCSFF